MDNSKEEKKGITCSKCGTAFSLGYLVERNCVNLMTEDKRGLKLGRPKLRACCPHCFCMWEYNLAKDAAEKVARQLLLARS